MTDKQNSNHRDGASIIQDDFKNACEIMKHAVQTNIQEFSLSGLKVPKIIQTWEQESELPIEDDLITEICIFQERLHDRIAELTHDRQKLEQIWGFNERTREFRKRELRLPKFANTILGQLSTLVNALFANNSKIAAGVLSSYHRRQFDLVDDVVCKSKTLHAHAG
ncbi:MAG: hypothetical protein COB78_06940 [Hyphomicrobiales bacterium]|nr:MAG: hypothetical protein COB78_06940 [Hyphomicrobiales bacterium]